MGRISEGAGGSPGFVSSGSDKGGFRSGFAENHIAYRGSPNHPLAGRRDRFFPSFFQRLTRPVALCAPAPKPSLGMRSAGTSSRGENASARAALLLPKHGGGHDPPKHEAVTSANASSGIAGAASRNGTRLMTPRAGKIEVGSVSRRAQNGMSSSMSLLRAPAATARRGAPDGPPDPKSPLESSEPKLPPAPLLRPSSMVRLELNP
jgi:hypothetical protein